MRLERFDLERIQSEWEHVVKYNLSESGVEPMGVAELLGGGSHQQLILDQKLGYPQTNGSIPLRELISNQYHGADADNVTVTNGGAEANFVAVWRFFQESKERNELIVQLPNYMQIWGVGRAFGAHVKPFWLRNNGLEWVPDIEELKNSVSKRTSLIAICNPNNPTGAIMSPDYLKVIADIAKDVGAWVLSDEVYLGAELDGKTTPTMFDFYDKVLVTNSLSKAYGLPGLRIGWIASQNKEVIFDLWAHTDYTSIAPSSLSDTLAIVALKQDNRERIIERTRKILRNNWLIVGDWLQSHSSLFECNSPKGGAICLAKYNSEIDSVELARRLINEKSVLLAPGDYFLMPQHIRIGYGHDERHLVKGLESVVEILLSIS